VAGFLRYQSAVPNSRGSFPGVFALANGLRDSGALGDADRRGLEEANALLTEAYVDPTTVVPGCYDRAVNPGARAWFRADAADLLELTRFHVALLERLRVPWMELRTRTPGRIVYEDDVQVVAVPFSFPGDWPLR
jgi:hypothetical protein